MPDDEGVLSNLPHSRPGQRSAKRAASTAGAAARRAERSGAPAAKPARAATPRPEPKPDPPASTEQPGGRDPVGDVLRTGAKVTGTGVRVAAGVAGHVLRRIPRP